MADKSLEEAARRAVAGGGMGGAPGGGDAEAAAAKRAEMEERRRMMLASILSNEARERLNRIALVKPEKAAMVEQHLLRRYAGKPMVEKVSEGQVIAILEQLAKKDDTPAGRVVVHRKGRAMEDDDDDSDDDF